MSVRATFVFTGALLAILCLDRMAVAKTSTRYYGDRWYAPVVVLDSASVLPGVEVGYTLRPDKRGQTGLFITTSTPDPIYQFQQLPPHLVGTAGQTYTGSELPEDLKPLSKVDNQAVYQFLHGGEPFPRANPMIWRAMSWEFEGLPRAYLADVQPRIQQRVDAQRSSTAVPPASHAVTFQIYYKGAIRTLKANVTYFLNPSYNPKLEYSIPNE